MFILVIKLAFKIRTALNVQFKIDNGVLYYYDNLSFGTLKVVDKTEHLEEKLKTIASNITNNNTTFELFSSQINKTKNSEKEIGLVLMDQKVISGIGNYLRSDILWLSKISPFRKVRYLKKSDLKKLYKYSKSLSKEINVLPKNFVYDMKEDIYGNKIIKEPLYTGKNKRFIYWVPKIQV
jgi:formamidopyrimidine-DNA glycosylase